jgi:hypothetical protein
MPRKARRNGQPKPPELQPYQEPEPSKPGPRDTFHSLYPLTFEQAVERALRYKPTKPKKRSRKEKPAPAKKRPARHAD